MTCRSEENIPTSGPPGCPACSPARTPASEPSGPQPITKAGNASRRTSTKPSDAHRGQSATQRPVLRTARGNHRTRLMAGQRLQRGNWGTLAEFTNASATTHESPVTGSETPQAPTNGDASHHRRRGGRSPCGTPVPRIPAPPRPGEAPATSAGISTIRQSKGLSMAPVRFPDNTRRKSSPCLSASTECAAPACPATAGSVDRPS